MAPKDLNEGDDHRSLRDNAPARVAPQKAPDDPTPPRQRRGKRRFLLLALLIAGLVAAGYAGRWWWTEGRFEISTDDAYVHADFAILAPKISGYVASVEAVETTHVEAGAPLVTLDDGDYKARLRMAEASVDAKQAALVRIDSQVAAAHAAILGAEANVEAAKAALSQAESDYERYQELNRSDYASRQKLESTRAAADSARATLAARQAAVDEAEASLKVTEAGRGEAQAALEGAQAERDQATRDLAATVIRAPFAGSVGNLSVAVGDYVQPGSRMLAVVPLSAVYIDANFKETDLVALAPGAPVTVEVDAYPGKSFTAHVAGFNPATGAIFSLLPPENATGNFTKVVQRVPVRIAVPAAIAAQGWLRPGLSVIVTADSRHAAGEGETGTANTAAKN